MKSRIARRLLVVLVLATAACGSRRPANPPASQAPSIESLGDDWIGGFDQEPFLRVDFAAGVARLHPSDERAPLGIIHPKRDGALKALRFAIDDGKHRRSFDLRATADDVLEGSVTEGKGPAAHARLVHLSSFERKPVDDAFGGTYAVDGDPRRLLFVDEGTLFDTRDGSERRLFLRSARRALVGAGVATAHPARGDLFVDERRSLRLEGDAPFAATRFDVKAEEIRFESAHAMLQGTLLAPPGPGPHPVVVNVHGSGRVTRKDHWGNAMARVFLAQGYAVFLYDKRGVGDSGGEYVGRGARDTNNVSRENLDRLASDAAAAAAMLAERKDIDASRVGLIGLSQAGWIIPLAAKSSKAVRFVIVMSGPAVHTSIELAFSALVGSGDSCLPIDEADRVAREHAPRTGFDPASTIDALTVPGLWIFGALDSSIPVDSSMRVLEPMKKSHPLFEALAVPGAGHELYQVRRDTEDERLVSPGIAPAVLDTIRSWLTRLKTR